ncbi:MAG TPA: universal stress protein [Microthrixaceae bacterium]|jgi:nucleotide-binding universal stress UspA family protein|nr:universal stress protein [Microthrixaceae bacterium]HQF95797.1 universal stress protein [Microthrixaceae bacterium]
MSEMLRPDDWEDPVVIPDLPAMARILVPFDGSHTAERALAWAELLAGASGAEIVVMVAYQPPLTKKGRGATYVEAMRDEMQAESESLANEAVELVRSRGGASRGIVVRGEAAAAALDVAETESVDLIVIGRRGLSSELTGIGGSMERLRSSLGGGVTERVARYADAPVMVV